MAMNRLTHAESIAKYFHDVYERLAPAHGYETRSESAVVWENVPEQNKALMVAVVEELLRRRIIPPDQWYCLGNGRHTNPSPSQFVGAWCNDCGSTVPLHHFDPQPEPYMIDGRDHRLPDELRLTWDPEKKCWR